MAAPCHSLLGCWDYVFTASVIANFEAGKKGFIWETLRRFVTESMEKAKRVCESKQYRTWNIFSKVIARQHFRVV